jgi:ABC-type transport system involved in multi-copper enzyme maturation permease subunit
MTRKDKMQQFNNIYVIAKNTFKETVRDKVFYGIAAFAILFLGMTIFISSLSLGKDIKVTKDLGLAGIYVFSLLITIFMGSSLISKELEKKTLYIILSKPVTSLEFILGKFFGLLASITINVLVMTVIYLAIVAYKDGGFDYLSLFSILLLIFELSIFITLTTLFSTFTSPMACTIYTVIILYTGHSLSLLTNAADKAGSSIGKALAYSVYYIFPNLEKFNIRNSIVYGIMPNASQIIFPIVYATCFSVIILWLTNLALKKQEL